jgi:16S rRNA (uracil1498-N3)-methyltransferase
LKKGFLTKSAKRRQKSANATTPKLKILYKIKATSVLPDVAFLHLRVHYFLDPEFDPATGILSEEESRHAIKSLRMQIGDAIKVGDGKGTQYLCEVSLIGKKQLITEVLNKVVIPKPLDTTTIALAPTKNTARYEWFLEKATEMGVDRIIPLETKRTERARLNTNRCERIIHAAAKQSQQVHIPELMAITDFTELSGFSADVKWIAHCLPEMERKEIHSLLPVIAGKSRLVLIGPEGDFTPEEIEMATAWGFHGISLGDNRLRTETAGVFVAALISAFRS